MPDHVDTKDNEGYLDLEPMFSTLVNSISRSEKAIMKPPLPYLEEGV